MHITSNSVNNVVDILGEICSAPRFIHEIYGEGFYTVSVRINRLSDASDCIRAMVSDRLINPESTCVGDVVRISGQFRSHNSVGEKPAVRLYVFVQQITFEDVNTTHINSIYLDGFICKKPSYRNTPSGKEISDLLVSVRRSYGRADYIPCICWGRNAKFASGLCVGDRILICGRIQSREYVKKISEYEAETRIAYEVSIRNIRLVVEE